MVRFEAAVIARGDRPAATRNEQIPHREQWVPVTHGDGVCAELPLHAEHGAACCASRVAASPD